MSDLKQYPMYQIDTNGDLKFVNYIENNFLPRIGDTIVNLITDEDGEPIRRIYYKVRDIIISFTNRNDKNKNLITTANFLLPVIHVTMEIDEPI